MQSTMPSKKLGYVPHTSLSARMTTRTLRRQSRSRLGVESGDAQSHTLPLGGSEPGECSVKRSKTDEDPLQPTVAAAVNAKESTEVTKDNVFPFLKLPAELRNEVYRHALVVGYKGVTGVVGDSLRIGLVLRQGNLRIKQPYGVAVGLFYANRQTHKEATSVFYGENTFSGGYDEIIHFTLMIRPLDKILQSLAIADTDYMLSHAMGKYSQPLQAFWFLDRLSRLQRLELIWDPVNSLSHRCMFFSQRLAWFLFWHGYGWIRFVGETTGDAFAALKRIHVLFPEPSDFDETVFRTEMARLIKERDLGKPLSELAASSGANAKAEAFVKELADRECMNRPRYSMWTGRFR